MTRRRQPASGRRQRGYLMAGVVVAVALVTIFSLQAVNEWAEVLRRDNEAEMIFRAQEIVRAIQRYRVARGQPPMKLEDLMEPGPRGEYFLRRLYDDPLVRDGKWGMLYVGPGNTVVDPNAEGDSPVPGLPANHPALAGLNRGLGDQQPGEAGDERSGSGLNPAGGMGRGGRLGRGGPGSPSSRFGGGEMSGLPIAGVKTLCKDEPFRVYNGLTEYSQWLFTFYDLELQRLPGQQRPGGPRGRAGQVPGQGMGRQQSGQSPLSLPPPGSSGRVDQGTNRR